MACDPTLLLTRPLQDPALLAHLEACARCRADMALLNRVLPAFHDGLANEPRFTLPAPPSIERSRMPSMPTLLLAAASTLVVALAGSQALPPAPPAAHQAAAGAPSAELARKVAMIPWSALSELEWAKQADSLVPDAQAAVANDEATEDNLVIVLQAHRAAENSNRSPALPFFGRADDGSYVGVFFEHAVKLVRRRPQLLEGVDPEVRRTLEFRAGQLAAPNPGQ